MLKIKLLLSLTILLLNSIIFAQTTNIEGTISNAKGEKIEGAEIVIDGTDLSAKSNNNGAFSISNIPFGSYSLVLRKEQFKIYYLKVIISQTSSSVNLGNIILTAEDGVDQLSSEELIPSVSLSDADVNDAGGTQNVSGILTSSRDVFFNTAAFAFGAMRFSIRGYDSEYSTVYINGIPMNSLESGRASWTLWGGLNDAFRSRDNTIGLGLTDYTFGGPGGATQMDVRASAQWKQFRVGAAVSNRSYVYRPMFIYSTGLMKNGWAFSISGSYRGAEQAQIPGSYYSAASYYAAAEKRFNKHHGLNLSVFGSPRVRGANAPVTAEQQEIARLAYGREGYFYNPSWGWQTKENGSGRVVRNSRYSSIHVPVIILTHDWDIDEKQSLSTSISYQFGKNGSTSLNWYNAPDPRPEYYRKWPSYFDDTDSSVALQLRQEMINNPDMLQIDWDGMFEVNRNSVDEAFSSTEKRARYVVEERRYDIKQYSFNTIYKNFVNDVLTLNGGVKGQYFIGHNYKVLEDLLGADYWIDIDQFADIVQPGNDSFAQNNLNSINNKIRKGDRFGYDYNSHIQNLSAWGQSVSRFGKFEAFVAGEVLLTRFWREGNIQNGRFLNNSLGNGPKHTYLNYNVKAGITYKLNGRNYFFLNGNYGNRAPYFRDAYVSPAYRDQLVQGITSTTIYGTEAGYILTAPKTKARVAAYYTNFLNDYYNKNFYSENASLAEDGTSLSGFINFIMTNVDKRHMGLELAIQHEVFPGLKLNAVAAIGEFIYTSRPDISIFLDYSPDTLVSTRKAYMKNAYVAGSPQMAYNFGINYNSPKFWFFNINFNYLMRNFSDFNPDRRTIEAVTTTNNPQYQQQFLEPGSQQWDDVLAQEQLPNIFTIDVFGGKSFRIKVGEKTSFIYINVGINNILNNRNIITGGFEQLRFNFQDNDPSTFPNRYNYGLGLNYFASIVYRLPI
jgi:hypothetical protein